MDKTHFLHLYNFQLVLLSQLHKKKTQLVCYPWLVQTSIENSENMFPMQLAITSDSIDNYVKHKMLEATGLKIWTIMRHYRVILSFTIYKKPIYTKYIQYTKTNLSFRKGKMHILTSLLAKLRQTAWKTSIWLFTAYAPVLGQWQARGRTLVVYKQLFMESCTWKVNGYETLVMHLYV